VAGSRVTLNLTSLRLQNSVDNTFDGDFVGGGSLEKSGAGSLVLGGDLAGLGCLSIFEGRVSLQGGYRAHPDLYLALNNGTTLDISGGTGPLRAYQLAGGGSIDLGANSLLLGGASAMSNYTGTINGTGGVRIVDGDHTFSGRNTYTGSTFVEDGQIRFRDEGSIESSASVNLGAFALVDYSGSYTGVVLNNLTGSGLLYGAGKNLTLNVTGGDVTYAGALLSGANFIKTGSGALELTNQFSHTGVTDIQGGTLAISGGGSIWNTSGVNVASGARLDLSQASAPTLNQLNMADGAALNLGSNSLVLGPYAGRCCPGPSGGQAVLWSSGIRLPQRQ